jgi:pre-mRNA-splicing helicase BRR2
VILIEPKEELARFKFHMISKVFSQFKVGKTFNELTKDTQVLLLNDIIVATPEAWEVVSRRWKARKGFENIGLFVVDGLHMLAEENGATL